MKLTFLGAGKMATAIATGLVDKQLYSPASLAAVDPSASAREAFGRATGVACFGDAPAALAGADAVIVAVKPQQASAAIAPLRAMCADKLVVSIAAGLPLATLSAWFGHERVVRVMPNTPAMVGCGAAVFSCAAGVSGADRELVETIFSAVGLAMEMAEEKLDAVTALSGSGPAYMFELVRVLVAGAEAIDLSADEALALAVQTMAGAAEMLRRGMGTPEQLRLAVTSPGGTTAAGLAVLEEADFANLMARVLRAARDRSLELGARYTTPQSP